MQGFFDQEDKEINVILESLADASCFWKAFYFLKCRNLTKAI